MSKMVQYLAEGDQLSEAVNTYRASREDASLTQKGTPVPDCNKSTKPNYQPQPYPTEIPGFPLNWDAAKQEIPDYGSMARVQATRASMAERRGKRAPLKPMSGPTLRKRDSVSRR